MSVEAKEAAVALLARFALDSSSALLVAVGELVIAARAYADTSDLPEERERARAHAEDDLMNAADAFASVWRR